MKSIFLILFIGLFSSNLFAQSGVNKSDKGVVLLIVLKNGKLVGSGTGFLIAPDIIATNYHVAGVNEVVALTPGRGDSVKPFKTQKIWGSSDYDLQLLKTSGLTAPVLSLSSELIKKGSDVTAIGYPGIAEDMIEFDGVESTISKGIVGRIVEASWKEGGPKFNVIQHSAAINKGNSGGPLLDLCGRVVGVNTLKAVSIGVVRSGVTITSQSEGIFYASAIDVLLDQLKKLGISVTTNSENCVVSGQSSGAVTTKINYPWVMPAAILGSLILAGLAVYLSLRKNNVIRETYTQFQKRSKSASNANKNISNQMAFVLKGRNSNGHSIRIVIDQKYPIGSHILVGRDSNVARIAIDDPTISRQHAIIEVANNCLRVRDLNSTNGTWINNKKVTDQFTELFIGQELRFGKAVFNFSRE